MDSYEVLLNPLQYVADDSKKGKAFLQSSLAYPLKLEKQQFCYQQENWGIFSGFPWHFL